MKPDSFEIACCYLAMTKCPICDSLKIESNKDQGFPYHCLDCGWRFITMEPIPIPRLNLGSILVGPDFEQPKGCGFKIKNSRGDVPK